MAAVETKPAETDLRAELAEIRLRLERLEEAAISPQRDLRSRLEGIPGLTLVDKDSWGAQWTEVLERMGFRISPSEPPFTAQEVQEQMVCEGLKPEDRVANTILEEMRGYRK